MTDEKREEEVERDEDGRPLTPDEVQFKRLHPETWARMQREKVQNQEER